MRGLMDRLQMFREESVLAYFKTKWLFVGTTVNEVGMKGTGSYRFDCGENVENRSLHKIMACERVWDSWDMIMQV